MHIPHGGFSHLYTMLAHCQEPSVEEGNPQYHCRVGEEAKQQPFHRVRLHQGHTKIAGLSERLVQEQFKQPSRRDVHHDSLGEST